MLCSHDPKELLTLTSTLVITRAGSAKAVNSDWLQLCRRRLEWRPPSTARQPLPGIEFHHFCFCNEAKAPFQVLGRIVPPCHFFAWNDEVTLSPPLPTSALGPLGLQIWTLHQSCKSLHSPSIGPTLFFCKGPEICSDSTQHGKAGSRPRWGQLPHTSQDLQVVSGTEDLAC